MKLILAILFFSSQVFAGLPPTTLKGQASGGGTTFFFQAPYSQATKTGSVSTLIETDYQNRLANPSFENLVSTTSWTSGSGASPALELTNVQDGLQSLAITMTSVNGLVISQDVTPTTQSQGQNYEYGMWVKTSASNLQVCARNAGATIGNCNPVYSDSLWHYYPNNYPGVSSGSIGVSLITTSSTSGTVYVDHAYVGPARNFSNVAQAYFFGGMEQAGASGCNYLENTSSGASNFADLGTGSGCNAWVPSGNVTAVGSNDHRAVVSNIPPGMLDIKISSEVYTATTGLCNYRLSDGTNVYQPQNMTSGSGAGAVPALEFHVPYTTAQSSITFKLQAADNQASGCGLINDTPSGTMVSWKIYYFPTSSQLAINPNLPTGPTIQKFTSGSGTYTTPIGVTSIKVRMVGGGGGGGGGGNSASAGGLGGNTTFGTTLLSANAGVTYIAGGTASCGSVTNCTALSGASGNGGVSGGTGTNTMPGGSGGNSIFGGGGAGINAGAGGNGVTNTGGGGAGGGATSVGFGTGSGGGAGGYVEAIINNPSATYSYTVGAGGTSGAAGSGGANGGAGGSGYIEITEYYQGMNAPVLLGGVTTSSTGASKVEFAHVAGATSATDCGSSPCVLYNPSGSGFVQVTRSATGTYQATFSGFSQISTCSCNAKQTVARTCAFVVSGTNTVDVVTGFPSDTSGSVGTIDTRFDLTCWGSR